MKLRHFHHIQNSIRSFKNCTHKELQLSNEVIVLMDNCNSPYLSKKEISFVPATTGNYFQGKNRVYFSTWINEDLEVGCPCGCQQAIQEEIPGYFLKDVFTIFKEIFPNKTFSENETYYLVWAENEVDRFEFSEYHQKMMPVFKECHLFEKTNQLIGKYSIPLGDIEVWEYGKEKDDNPDSIDWDINTEDKDIRTTQTFSDKFKEYFPLVEKNEGIIIKTYEITVGCTTFPAGIYRIILV